MCVQVNMDPILKYINTCNEKALTREQDAKRTAPLAQDDDPRVDVCIYFLSPHRVKPIDLKFMTELSALAPVVPVLAKADSMTTDELQHFRSGVKQALAQAGPPVSHQRTVTARVRYHSSVSRRLWPIHLRLLVTENVTPLSRAYNHLPTRLCGLLPWWAADMHASMDATMRLQ